MSFAERAIDLTIRLAVDQKNNKSSTFEGTGSNTVKITGLRTMASIVKAGGLSQNVAQVRVFGVPVSVMNQISTLGVRFLQETARNKLLVEVGDKGGDMAAVFQGDITQAWVDFDGSPDVALNIVAYVQAYDTLAPTAPTSFPGPFDVATALSGMASRANLNFENNGVRQTLSSSYYSGSIMDQIAAVVSDAGITKIVDMNRLIIWPRNGSRGGEVPLISPGTGLVGYPRYNGQGISLTTLLNPSVGFGAQIQVESSQQPANGIWFVNRLAYDLTAEVYGGAWFCQIEAGKQRISQSNGG